MKFRKENHKFYVNGIECETHQKAWETIKEILKGNDK
jgi:hypothetical protein